VADPIERRNVYELVAERLLERINERGLRPGDALPTERELTEAYRVGRSSVREALRMLQSSGVISPAGKGVFVVAEYATPLNYSLHLLVTLDEANLLELFEVRKILEGETALRGNDEDLGRMGRAIEDMVAGLSAQDRYIAADLQFHLTIAASTRNRIALRMMQAIRGLLQRALASVYQIPGSPERSIEQHRTILEAVTRRDPDGARRAMLDHLLRVERDIQHTIASPPDAAAPSLVQAGRRKD
jgi:GntR family transcriptional repressor for pyruvate dehydrogenase complex